MTVGQGEKERFRSFAERYVIERAGHWKPGEEDTGAWAAIQDAKRVYHQIALAGDDVQERIAQAIEHAAKTQGALQAGNAQQAPNAAGLYGTGPRLTPIPPPGDLQNRLIVAVTDPRTPPDIKQRIKNFLMGRPGGL
jgi:hypothetical protein